MRRGWKTTIATALVAFTATGTGAGTGARAEEPIAIGLSSPLTGGAAFLGQHQRWGAELAVERINEAGGVLDRPLALKVQDNQCNPSQGVASVERLITVDEVSALVGALCSSVTLAVMPVAERAQVPLVVDVSTSKVITELSGTGGNEWTFRINPSDEGLAVSLARHLASRDGVRRIAFVGEDTDYGRGGHDALAAALGEHGIEVVSADFFAQGAQDFSPVLTKLRSQQPDAVALYLIGADELNFLRQYRGAGVRFPLTGRVEFADLQSSIIESGSLDGATSVFPYAAEIDTPENRAFVDAFEAEYGEKPNYQSFEAYEAVHVIADAIKRAGAADPSAIRDALKSTRYPSLLGTVIEFDANNQAHNKAAILRIDGKSIVVEGLYGT
jgi:branched-chain amino acid transport system substrate-binding protein